MKPAPLFVLFVIYPGMAISQNIPTGYDAISKMQQQVWMDKRLAASDPNHLNIKGTPYIFVAFSNGNLYFTNRTFIADKLINYNCYEDQVLFSDGNNIYSINSQEIDYFTLTGDEDGKILLFKQVFLPAEKKRIFMQVISQGETILFKRYRKEFLKADAGQPYGSNRIVDEYNDYSEYYVSVNGKDPVILKPRKSSVLEIFSDQSEIIDDFIKNEKIDLKNESDIKKLIEHYDKL